MSKILTMLFGVGRSNACGFSVCDANLPTNKPRKNSTEHISMSRTMRITVAVDDFLSLSCIDFFSSLFSRTLHVLRVS